ncbi:MAG: hypothetical protein R3B41_00740 [Candidatus Doudnabacteria bacterium]
MRLIYRTILCLVLASVGSLALGVSVEAAQIMVQPQELAVPQPNDYMVIVTIDTEGEMINAIEGQVVIDKALGQVKTVTESGSIIPFWVIRPQVSGESSQIIKFSGTIPGGYQGSAGILFNLVMPAYQGEQITEAITLQNVKALRNDGLGTSVAVKSVGFRLGGQNLSLDSQIKDQIYDQNRPDNEPPEAFTPQIAQSDQVYNGQWFVSFAAVDKQSGIEYYEVQETKNGRIKSDLWVKAESPYLLQDQNLQSYVYVTAVDRAGNERIVKISPRNPIPLWQSWWPLAVFVGLLVVLFVFWRHKRKVMLTTK